MEDLNNGAPYEKLLVVTVMLLSPPAGSQAAAHEIVGAKCPS
jgi:hypothetical protein